MTERDDIRAAMNAAFLDLPHWIREAFGPVRDSVSILLDRSDDALARSLVEAIPPPNGETPERLAEFAAAKAAMLAGINGLIAATEAANPLLSPEAQAMAALAAERRAAP